MTKWYFGLRPKYHQFIEKKFRHSWTSRFTFDYLITTLRFLIIICYFKASQTLSYPPKALLYHLNIFIRIDHCAVAQNCDFQTIKISCETFPGEDLRITHPEGGGDILPPAISAPGELRRAEIIHILRSFTWFNAGSIETGFQRHRISHQFIVL